MMITFLSQNYRERHSSAPFPRLEDDEAVREKFSGFNQFQICRRRRRRRCR